MDRCYNCKKKMGLMEFICKCEYKFCKKCLLPENHNCQFDFRESGKRKLLKDLTKITNEKIIKI
jgi:predicted nucleic acid binding AN1-type Zn finger protein